jgi:hypothetical protein
MTEENKDERRDEENENVLQEEIAVLRERFAETGGPDEDDDVAAFRDRIQ